MSEDAKVFKTADLEEAGIPDDDTEQGWKVILCELTGETRWGVTKRCVFREPGQPEGEAWEIAWEEQSGDSAPGRWEYEKTIEARRVVPFEKLVIVWERPSSP